MQGKKGGFKDTRPEELLSGVLRAAYTRANVDPKLIEDVIVGNVLPPGGGATAARMAAIHAGLPLDVPIATVNRQCSSGLTAVNEIAGQIISGQIDIGIGKCSCSDIRPIVLGSCALSDYATLFGLLWNARGTIFRFSPPVYCLIKCSADLNHVQVPVLSL